MKLLYITPEDRHWMKRRSLRCLRRCGAILLMVALMRTGDAEPGSFPPVDSPGSGQRSAIDLDPPSEWSPPGVEASPAPRAVPPTGWRRTSRGWEKVDWARQYPELLARKKTMREWMRDQAAAEAGWTGDVASFLRQIPPLGIAMSQILAIWLIARQATPHRVTART